MTSTLKYWTTVLLGLLISLMSQFALAQTCAAPGRDGPATPGGVVNRYHQGVGTLAAGATSLTLGAASGAAGTVTAGDLLLIIQMQGASIDSSDDIRYGDGSGPAVTSTTSISQASGYTALGQAGLHEFVRVTGVTGTTVNFSPALSNSYVQNTGAQPRRTYQVIRVPQYSAATLNSATPLTPLAWTGLVGGVVAIDVAGQLSFTGAGPHVNASNMGFRGGAQGVADSACCTADYWYYRRANTADGGTKGEGIAGTPRYVNASTQGSFDSGTRRSEDPGAAPSDNGAGHMGYPRGDYARGAPGNAGGGGNSHNSGGGGGGNGGVGGNGGQTFNGDGLRDAGGHGGSRAPQDGLFGATRVFMGGGGGSASLNNASTDSGHGGRGGGIIYIRAGQISGTGVLRADGQRGWDPSEAHDGAGGGGAGGSIVVIAGGGHGGITAQARGGNGGDSNKNNESNSAPYYPPTGVQGAGCCNGEREGPGGGGGGGVVLSNVALGSVVLTGGTNGLSRADKFAGFSGNMLAAPGAAGASALISPAGVAGSPPGYQCLPQLTVSKSTSTPSRTVPPETTGQYSIVVQNPALGSGVAYGVALTDILSAPFTLTGTTATVTYAAGASGPVSPMTISGTSTVVVGTAGHPTNAFTLEPGSSLTVTFRIALNGASAGTYQNPASVRITDPTRTTGGSVTAVTNPSVGPGQALASGGGTLGGSNYNPASSTAEDIVITGTASLSADVSLVKTGPASVEVGQTFSYTLLVLNSGPSDISGSLTITDNLPAALGTVSWVCTLLAGTGDCDTVAGGTGATGSGSPVVLNQAALNSGGQLQIIITAVAGTAGAITNTATVGLPAGYTDPTPSNNTGTATTTIVPRTADLSVTKSDGVTTVTSGGVTAYTIVVANGGPSAAHGAVVTDPAATGLSKLAVSCTAAGGAVCPAGLSTSTFQAGIAIEVLPAGSTLTFLLTAQVDAASGTVTNTVSVSAPPGVTDTTPGNNSAADANAVATAVAVVVSAAQICPAGTTEQMTNLLSNSNFADTAASVGSSALQWPVNTNIADNATYRPAGVGPQTGVRTPGAYMNQRPFPGDAARSVPAANNWLYSNGNQGQTTAFRVWRQTSPALVAGRSYQFILYGSNARAIGSGTGNTPIIEQRVTAGSTTYVLGSLTYPNHPTGTSDTWVIQQSLFSATATSVVLELWDTRAPNADAGDNWAVTQILLRECRPNADVFVTKSNGTDTVQALGTTAYVLTVGNNGPGPADSIVLRDPAVTGLVKTGLSCAALGSGAQCPLAPTIAGLEGAGLTIPSLPAGTTVRLTVTANVTALNGTVTNSASLTLPFGLTDPDLGNNIATDADAVRGVANITVAKTNNVGTVTSGATTSYTVTVANFGPSDASGSVVTDPPATGLSCTTAATCTASGGASCAASIPIATLQSGYTIPSLPSGGQIRIVLTCQVTASGS